MITFADPAYIKEGSGSLKAALTGMVRVVYDMSPAKDISDYMNGYLHLWVYINDVSLLGGGQIELTSGGTCDQQELSWSITAHVKKSGWNELYLPLSAATATGGTFNPKSCNYLRIYCEWKNGNVEPKMYFDDIRLSMDKNG